MLFSTAAGYALRTLAVLPDDGSFRLAKDLAKQLGLPGPYLAKILQTLAQGGILESVRGPKGGFRLAFPASSIRIGDVVRALDGAEALCGCVMGFPHCGGDNPCPLHQTWAEVRSHLEASLTRATLQELQALATRMDKDRKAPLT